MEIAIAKFSPQEVNFIKKINPIIGNIEDLEMYNSTNYFNVIKAYQNNKLVGYGVIFLGHNGIESNDVSLEDIVYFGNPQELNEFLNAFLKELIYSENYIYKVENYYYNEENFSEDVKDTLEHFYFMPKGLSR